MNRSWISKLSRAFCPAVVGTLVLTACAAVQAGTLGTMKLEGRLQGQTAWATSLQVAPGDVVEYRILADLNPVGSSNGTNTITDATTPANSGFQSLSLKITQDPAAPIQVSFNPPLSTPNGLASFRNGWADGTGGNAGTPTARAGSANMDITGIRPVHASGVYTGVDAEPILEGSTFNIATAPAGTTTVLSPSWGTVSGGMKINGAAPMFIQVGSNPPGQASNDPLIGFAGLTLTTVPEPSTIALIGMGLLGLVAVARRRRTA